MGKYPLHYLNDQEFENLAVLICSKILGIAVIPFSEGKDGGKDGRFTGKANCFPSESQPWNGNIIIQAKHTTKENASCSDSDFSTILNKEISKIQKMIENNELDYYLLFTNRKLTGGKDSNINKLFEKITYEIIADEKIQHFLQAYPDIVRHFKLNDLLKPLEFDESDLKEIIITLHSALSENNFINDKTDFSKIDLEKKNELNKLSKSYFEDVIRRDIDDFYKIDSFLKSPINAEIKNLYEDTVSELNAKITLRRDEYAEFGNLLDDFYNYVINNNQTDLKGKKRLVRTLLNYMYCQCDIGKKK